jgi:hypothetical protein
MQEQQEMQEQKFKFQSNMKRWISKRTNGQVVSISETQPEQAGNLIVQEIDLTREELDSAKQEIALREENGKLVRIETNHLPQKIKEIIGKLKTQTELSSTEKDKLLNVLIEKLL